MNMGKTDAHMAAMHGASRQAQLQGSWGTQGTHSSCRLVGDHLLAACHVPWLHCARWPRPTGLDGSPRVWDMEMKGGQKAATPSSQVRNTETEHTQGSLHLQS